MRLDYIEIGTSDFDTLVESSDGFGISIEPLNFYLEKLPVKENNIKLNVAISDVNGKEFVYYIHPDDIEKYNLPDWSRGCNSIKNPHPSALMALRERGLESLYKKDEIEVITWDTLIRRYAITYVEYLKLDTEGHDTVILNSILDSKTNILPRKILFESNILTKEEDIEKIKVRLISRGYKISRVYSDNILVELDRNLPDKIIFASNDSDFIKFWEENSKMCSEILRITPVLFHITDQESNFEWDTHGIVRKIRYTGVTSLAAQISRLYAGNYFPEEKLMISDIDMFLFDPDFLKKSLTGSDLYDVTILGSDAYDRRRPESLPSLSDCTERFPMCYIIAKGKTLNEIMKITEGSTFLEFVDQTSFSHGFNTDEVIFSKNLINSRFTINRVNRGYVSNFFLKDRIEKTMFGTPSNFRINLKELKDLSGYVEFHCPNYYQNIEEINHLINLVYKK